MVSVSSLLPAAILGAFRSKSGAPFLLTLGKIKLLVTGAATTAAMASALGGWLVLRDDERAAFVDACAAKFERPAAAPVCARPEAAKPPVSSIKSRSAEFAQNCLVNPFATDTTERVDPSRCASEADAAPEVAVPESAALSATSGGSCAPAPETSSVRVEAARAACGCILDAARRMSDGDVDVVRAFRARLDDPGFDRHDRLGFPLPLGAAFIDRAGGAAAAMAAGYFDRVAGGCGLRGF